jgi:integrase
MELIYSCDMAVRRIGTRWWLDFYQNGKRVRESVTIPGKEPKDVTKTEALKALAIRKAEIATGKFDIVQTRKQVPFDRAVKSFLKNYSETKKSSRSDNISSKALLRYFGAKNLSFINSWRVDKYKSERLKTIGRHGKLISKATVNRETAFLKTMLNYAVRRGWLSENPLKGYKLYKEKLNKLRTLSEEEFKAFCNSASDLLKPILVMAYCTGMRKSEILDLKWENVDLDEGYIRVEETKNDEPRIIPINKMLNDILNSVQYTSSEQNVFLNIKGEPVKEFKTAFNGALRRSGVKKFTFHDLRHTFATNLVMNKVDLVTIKELMGHSTIQMTMRYSHPTPEHKKLAVESLNVDLTGQNMGNNECLASTDNGVTNRNH